MSIIQSSGPSPAQDPHATHEVGGMLERMDAQGQVTERLLLSLGDWQVIPDDQGRLRVLDAMQVPPKPVLLRLRVWRNRMGVAWQAGDVDTRADNGCVGPVDSLEVAQKQKLIDCETDLQTGGERFRLIPSQQTIQTSGTHLVPRDTLAASHSDTPTERRGSQDSWKEAVGSLTRSMESIQAMVERWYGEAQLRCDLELSRERLRSLSSQLAFCRNQCQALGDLCLSDATGAGDAGDRDFSGPPQPIVREVDGELAEARDAALGLWSSLCADPIELRAASLSDALDPEEAPTWESREELWDLGDTPTDWEVAREPQDGLVEIEQPERVEGGDEETPAVLRAESRREESMREWLQGHFEGRQEEYVLLEQLLFQQPARRVEIGSGDCGSSSDPKPDRMEGQVGVGMERKEEQASGSGGLATAAGRADRIAVLFGCVLILGGVGMWNLNLSAWNSKFAGVVSGVIGSLWLIDSILRLRSAGDPSKPSIEA
jgi:hypothetical protein